MFEISLGNTKEIHWPLQSLSTKKRLVQIVSDFPAVLVSTLFLIPVCCDQEDHGRKLSRLVFVYVMRIGPSCFAKLVTVDLISPSEAMFTRYSELIFCSMLLNVLTTRLASSLMNLEAVCISTKPSKEIFGIT